jgi:hypothetical protein
MKGRREGIVTHSRFETVSPLAGLFHLVLSFLTPSRARRSWRVAPSGGP